jgi:hypothetical protein
MKNDPGRKQHSLSPARTCFARRNILCVAGFFMIALPVVAWSETLSEPEIRQLYKQAADVASNPKKTFELMQRRLDDGFTIDVKSSRTLGNAPAQNGEEKYTKNQLMDQMLQVFNMVKIESYEQNIVDIKFSKDGKWGYVSYTTGMRGTVAVNLDGGKTGSSVYLDKEACIDTLTLKGGLDKIVRSDCTVQSQLYPPQ